MTSLPSIHRVYAIRCMVDGNRYIGQTTQTVRNRWKAHCSLLRRRRHPNHHLQADWNLYGADVFKLFLIGEFDNAETADCVERREILNSRLEGLCYNMQSGGLRSFGFADETLERISQTLKQRIAEGAYEPSPMPTFAGRHHTAESKQRIAAAKRGWKPDPAHIERLSAYHRGRKRTEEQLQHIRHAAILRGEKNQKQSPSRFCVACGLPLERKRYNGRLEDFGVFLQRKSCGGACKSAIRQKESKSNGPFATG